MGQKALLAVYSAAHLWVDLSCALLLLTATRGLGDAAVCLLVYNFCAFALQMPLGLLVDRLDRNAQTAAVGCCLVALAYALPLPMAAAAAAGLGNALFHLGAGVDVLNRSARSAAALGIFVSPGAAGLFLGGLWAAQGGAGRVLAPLLLLALAAAILPAARRALGAHRSGNAPLDPRLQGRAGTVFLLFLVVVLRSYVGMNQAFAWKGDGLWAAVLLTALVLGKAAGGFLMDWTSTRKTAVWSLLPAAAMYFFSALPLPGVLAVFLFNMTMPVTLWAVARVLPGAKGFSFGLLTFGLFLGYLPSYMGWPSLLTGPAALAGAAVVSLLLLWLAMEREAAVC